MITTSSKLTAILLAGALAVSAQESKPSFDSLVHHWNLDEGRDWHDMPFPFETDIDRADDSVGSNKLIIPGPKTNNVWASGRQFSGIQLRGGWVRAQKNIDIFIRLNRLGQWTVRGFGSSYLCRAVPCVASIVITPILGMAQTVRNTP